MNDIDLIKLLGQSGIAVAALFVLARIVYRVGERMIAAIDRVSVKIDEHTKEDLASHAQVRDSIGELREDVAILSTRVHTTIQLIGPQDYPKLQGGGRDAIPERIESRRESAATQDGYISSGHRDHVRR